MRWVSEIVLRFRSLLRAQAVDHELDSEIRFHVERAIAAKVSAGVSPAEARLVVARQFGGVEQLKEECRDMRRVNWLQDLAQDLRYGLRVLRKAPGFTVVGIGLKATLKIRELLILFNAKNAENIESA